MTVYSFQHIKTTVMKISDKGVEFIAQCEGRHRSIGDGRYTAYRCPAGVLTIYTGITEGVYEGMIVTEDEGKSLFRRELAKHEAAVTRCVTVEMTQHQFDALVSFSYNLGTGALASSSIVKLLNKGNPQAAARWFAPYCNARVNGVLQPLPGLVRRRAAEAAMFLQPDAPSVEPDMPQAVVAPPDAPTGSRKLQTADAMQVVTGSGAVGLAGLSLGEQIGYAQQAAAFVREYGIEMVIGLAVVAFVGFAIFKYLTKQDYAEGRYIPRSST